MNPGRESFFVFGPKASLAGVVLFQTVKIVGVTPLPRPVLDGFGQLVEFLEVADPMAVDSRLGAAQDLIQQGPVENTGGQGPIVGLHGLCQRHQALVIIAIELVCPGEEILLG